MNIGRAGISSLVSPRTAHKDRSAARTQSGRSPRRDHPTSGWIPRSCLPAEPPEPLPETPEAGIGPRLCHDPDKPRMGSSRGESHSHTRRCGRRPRSPGFVCFPADAGSRSGRALRSREPDLSSRRCYRHHRQPCTRSRLIPAEPSVTNRSAPAWLHTSFGHPSTP